MRIRHAITAGFLVVASAVGISWAAPPSGKVVTTSTQTMSDIRRAPPDIQRPGLQGIVTALSANECTNLGGTVYDDPYHVCASGQLCDTTDNKGAKHAVCLSVKK